MSVTVLKDVEEALLREFRSILIADQRTQSYEAFPTSFDPFTGEKISSQPLEGHFFDSSSNAYNIEYPNVFIKLLRSDEDRHSGRIVPPYGKEINYPITTASRAYEVITSDSDLLMTSGTAVTMSTLKSRLINSSHILSILSGPNAGNYYIQSIALNGNGPHSITLDPKIVKSLPVANYRLATKTLTFLSPVDLNTVAAGDIFTDSTAQTFTIGSVDVVNNAIILTSSGNPSLASGSFIMRSGNILQHSDTSTARNFLILDPSRPIVGKGLLDSSLPNTSKNTAIDWAIPLDLTFSITIDTKAFDDHNAVWNRVWEEFNPPRNGLSIIVRTSQSAESSLAKNLTVESSDSLIVEDTSKFIVGETIRVFNKISVGFETQIVGINYDTNTLMLADSVPNSFTVQNGTSVLSNSVLVLWEWDFMSHRDNSNDGSHYWSHLYEYGVQVWVNKKQGEEIRGVIKQINASVEDFNSHVIDSIKVP